ncbi:UNVERIFIED_CONTAM: putative pre-splicing factor ATP-dependent RNA helicase DEAH4 [Sesamum calycinum]|uniref:RNA helicase n=1 Tax=Sesamum calycinum TaxID=2727403 RepID=A0AAW2QXF7_9LAMI
MAQLPILQFEEKIVETVEKNPVVVIIGETGSGKSTQLSQILHRRGYTKSGCIAVTQPRRVAAVSVSRRVAQELNVKLGEEVGYAIRFEDRTSEKTLIKDILLGLMKRLIKLRASNLKVLITSATLDGEKVSRFFSNCPILNVPGKLFPVEIQHSSERPKSYLEASLKTAIDIHVREPEGDVLIFMTGQDDIEKLVSKLEERIKHLEEGSCMDAIILPLHGSLPPELQVRVFSQPPPNCRRFIIATNIAETSLTVDGVVYVIDTGFVKQRQYNPSTGMYSLDVVQISKVQANQRAGRAGRTRPGKCYRLYPSLVYKDDFLDATVPEIQRSSLAGSVLYLKSLDLPDIDILKFDFLDPPSSEALEDALKQLYLIDAIDEDGSITSLGRTMAELPLEPSLSRTLLEANECGCLSHALTVAAMLSAETTLLLGEGMIFVKDVRKQLTQIMQKIAKGSMDVKTSKKRKEDQDYRPLRKALCSGFANQLAERMIRHNGYRTLGFKSQLVQVHPSSVLKPDEDGMLPNYVVFHELIATSRPYMRNVCAVEMQWVRPILAKLDKINVRKLSGGGSQSHEEVQTENLNLPKDDARVSQPLDDRESRILAARERFLARSRKANK